MRSLVSSGPLTTTLTLSAVVGSTQPTNSARWGQQWVTQTPVAASRSTALMARVHIAASLHEAWSRLPDDQPAKLLDILASVLVSQMGLPAEGPLVASDLAYLTLPVREGAAEGAVGAVPRLVNVACKQTRYELCMEYYRLLKARDPALFQTPEFRDGNDAFGCHVIMALIELGEGVNASIQAAAQKPKGAAGTTNITMTQEEYTKLDDIYASLYGHPASTSKLATRAQLAKLHNDVVGNHHFPLHINVLNIKGHDAVSDFDVKRVKFVWHANDDGTFVTTPEDEVVALDSAPQLIHQLEIFLHSLVFVCAGMPATGFIDDGAGRVATAAEPQFLSLGAVLNFMSPWNESMHWMSYDQALPLLVAELKNVKQSVNLLKKTLSTALAESLIATRRALAYAQVAPARKAIAAPPPAQPGIKKAGARRKAERRMRRAAAAQGSGARRSRGEPATFDEGTLGPNGLARMRGGNPAGAPCTAAWCGPNHSCSFSHATKKKE